MAPALITGRVDGAPFFANHEARLQKKAKPQAPTSASRYADLGFDMYSLGSRARTPSRRTPRGSRHSCAPPSRARYAFAPAPRGGRGYVVKSNPEVDLDAAVGAAQVASRYAFADEVTSGKVALGQFEPAR